MRHAFVQAQKLLERARLADVYQRGKLQEAREADHFATGTQNLTMSVITKTTSWGALGREPRAKGTGVSNDRHPVGYVSQVLG